MLLVKRALGECKGSDVVVAYDGWEMFFYFKVAFGALRLEN